MKYLIILLALTLLYSCKETPDQINIDKPISDITLTLEQKIIRQIEASHEIPATEKYSYKIYKEHLDNDDSLDYIITVNRLEYAKQRAIEGGKLAKRAESGFVGRYNSYIYMDGATKSFSSVIPVGSSPLSELEVHFENIRSEAFKDFQVDFKISSGGFRRFFTVYNKKPRQTFEIMLYDGFGSKENTSINVEYDTGSYSLAKDILIYSGKMKNIIFDDPEAVYSTKPIIESTKTLERRWFYNENERKYFTRKNS